MMTCFFGVPGCGKSTMLAKVARKGLRKRYKIFHKRYDYVFTNFHVNGCYKIDFDDLDKYKVYNALIIIDEMALCADNRNFKTFKQGIRDFITLHRHLGNDIVYATQNYDLVDLKIRALTDELWYMSKTVIPFFRSFTSAKRIYRKVSINEFTSDLTLGYRFCNLIESLFVSNYKLVFRPLYYRFFDSYDEDVLESRTVLHAEPWNKPTKRRSPWLFAKIKEFHGLLKKCSPVKKIRQKVSRFVRPK